MAADDGASRMTTLELCMQVGYLSTAYIPQCNAHSERYKDNPRCGTFLEVHRTGDDEVISDVRIPSEWTSGYRTTTIPVTFKEKIVKGDRVYVRYKGKPFGKWFKAIVDYVHTDELGGYAIHYTDPAVHDLSPFQRHGGSNEPLWKSMEETRIAGDAVRLRAKKSTRILCRGRYELWWVTRTKVGAMIEHIKPFGVVSPQCDWDPVNNKVKHYRTIGKPVQQE